jgi:ABC-type nickel/cobalt efflux system permease component RcnA
MFGSMLLFGFLLGVRHALEADHVAAVAALATRTSSHRGLLRLAAGWGTGHTLTILAVGAVVIAVGVSLPSASAHTLDRVVGAVLVLLGADVLRRALARRMHAHVHEHDDGSRHLHLHFHDAEPEATAARHEHEHERRGVGRALAMGSLHGLAGSAALLLLVLPNAGGGLAALGCLAVFGVGSIVGMLLFSLAIAFPLQLAMRSVSAMAGLEGVLGTATILVGVRILVA